MAEVLTNEPAVSSTAVPASAGGFLEFEKPIMRMQQEIDELQRSQSDTGRDLSGEIKKLRTNLKSTLKRIYSNLTPWETVQVARHPKRPLSTDYVRMIFRDFCELHGDRTFDDDRAIITGFGRLGGHRVMFVGHDKGKDIKQRMACNFGCAHPEGYRKALQKMRLAEKYHVPVVCLIDTQGAYPGVGAEERGIAYAIATNLMELSRLQTPVVAVVIGEGGSGGALGIGVADRVAMFQNSFYSVISPEGCAAILWKTSEKRKHAAEALRLTSRELLRLDIIDHVIAEPLGGAHREPEAAAANLEKYLLNALDDLTRLTTEGLVAKRYERIRRWGNFYESASERRHDEETRHARRSTSRASRLGRRFNRTEAVPA